MGKYDFLIDSMTWSFSRLTCYEECPYRFFQKYIASVDSSNVWFMSFGSYVHKILAEFFAGEVNREESVQQFLVGFNTEVDGIRPSVDVVLNFFSDTLNYLKSITKRDWETLYVERGVDFKVRSYAFTGFIDLEVADSDGKLWLVDHKSHKLKNRSKRSKPTKSDDELDRFMRQLYLYSIPFKETHDKYPDYLAFNCYRTGELVYEPFDIKKLERTEDWACSLIERIRADEKFNSNLDYFMCKNLCECKHDCEYLELFGW